MKDIISLDINNPIIKNHIVNGNHILPGLAYIDIIYEIFMENDYNFNELKLKNIRIYNQFIVSDFETSKMAIEWEESDKGYWNIKITNNDKITYVTAEMHRELTKYNDVFDFSKIFKEYSKNIESSYQVCRKLNLVHGDYMKVKGRFEEDDTYFYAELDLNDCAKESSEDFMFHPAILDGSGIFSAAEIALNEESNRLFLPICIDEFSAQDVINKKCYVIIDKNNIVKKEEINTLSIEYFNINGVKIGEIHNLYGKIIRDDTTKENDTDLSVKKHNFNFKEILKDIVSKKINVSSKDISINRGYYELGLASTEVLEVMKELEDTIDIKLNPIILFENPTIEKLSDYLENTYGNNNISEETIGNTFMDEDNEEDKLNDKDNNIENEKNIYKNGDIAIIGMAGKYPDADNLEEFWKNLLNGKDSIKEIPIERWNCNNYDSIKSPSGKSVSHYGGFINDADCFDNEFFRISPREAEIIDPQERLFLETSWHAIEDAGYTPDTLTKKDEFGEYNVGVFVGVMHKDYLLVGADSIRSGNITPLPLVNSSVANRVSYFCNFNGPSISIDTACSSALSAIHLAIESIYLGESKVAIAGGVNLSLHPYKYMSYGLMDMQSVSGSCKSFGDEADGYVSSEGVGAIILKPLEEAIKDKDNIYAVIKASSLNHVGTVSGITVPCPNAQGNLIKRTLKKARISSRTIGYVEAHGTGTSLGDPIEIKGLVKGFSDNLKTDEKCSIGSVKSNIGHGESCAGIAGIQKVILQLKNKTIVKSLHAEKENKYINFNKTPFKIQKDCTSFNPRIVDGIEYPRRAAISSFGATGSNGHIILEEYINDKVETAQKDTYLIPVSAKNKDVLINYLIEIKEFVKNNNVNISDFAYTMQVGRKALEERVVFIVSSLDELIENIDYYLEEGIVLSGYMGNLNENKSVLELFADENDLKILVSKWIKDKDYKKLGRFFASGGTIRWNEFLKKQRRISAPLYPFLKKRFWFEFPNKEHDSLIPSISCNTSDSKIDDILYLPKWQEEINTCKKQNIKSNILIIYGENNDLLAKSIKNYGLEKNKLTIVTTVKYSIEGKKSSNDTDILSKDLLEYNLESATLQNVDSVFFIGSINMSSDIINKCGIDELEYIKIVQAIKNSSNDKNEIDFFNIKVDNSKESSVNDSVGYGTVGLSYALAQSDYRFLVRNINITSEDSVEDYYGVVNDIMLEPSYSQGNLIKIQNGKRFTEKFYTFDQSNDYNKTGIKQKGSYIILGGSGKVGRSITKELLSKYKANVIWIGRRNNDDKELLDNIRSLRKNGGSISYYSADVTNKNSINLCIKKVLQDHPVINGAIFSGLVIDFNSTVRNIDKDDFKKVFSVKSLGLINLYESLKNIPLDFFICFSSAQSFSFSGAATLASYASGITFADTFAKKITKNNYPVGIINWGFWKCSFEGDEEKFEHINSITNEKGFKILEWFSQELIDNKLTQVIAMEMADTTKELMDLKKDYVVKILPKQEVIFPTTTIIDKENESISDLNAFMEIEKAISMVLLSKLNSIGFKNLWEKGITNICEFFFELKILNKYKKLFSEILDILKRNSLIKMDKEEILYIQEIDKEYALNNWSKIKNKYIDNINWKAQIKLVSETINNLSQIITGQVLATEIIFPNSSMELVEGIYRDNPYSDLFNNGICNIVEEYIQKNKSNNKIRIIEAGAGTGGTTKNLLKNLDKYSDRIEYYYTDVSKSFLDYGKEHYGKDRDYLKYEIWNIENEEINKNIKEGSFNIVIASNVIHATHNIYNTVSNIKKVLINGGIIIFNEGRDKSSIMTLTFGLLDGWYGYNDDYIRIKGSPLLCQDNWEYILNSAGYINCTFPVKSNRKLPYQIIVAQSNGLIMKSKVIKEESHETTKKVQKKESSHINMPSSKEQKENYVQDILMDELGKQLKVDKNDINIDVPFSDYGVDSLIGVSFINGINKKLNLSLKTAILFDYIKIKTLTKYIINNNDIIIDVNDENKKYTKNDYELTTEEIILENNINIEKSNTNKNNIDDISNKFLNKDISSEDLLNSLF